MIDALQGTPFEFKRKAPDHREMLSIAPFVAPLIAGAAVAVNAFSSFQSNKLARRAAHEQKVQFDKAQEIEQEKIQIAQRRDTELRRVARLNEALFAPSNAIARKINQAIFDRVTKGGLPEGAAGLLSGFEEKIGKLRNRLRGGTGSLPTSRRTSFEISASESKANLLLNIGKAGNEQRRADEKLLLQKVPTQPAQSGNLQNALTQAGNAANLRGAQAGAQVGDFNLSALQSFGAAGKSLMDLLEGIQKRGAASSLTTDFSLGETSTSPSTSPDPFNRILPPGGTEATSLLLPGTGPQPFPTDISTVPVLDTNFSPRKKSGVQAIVGV